MTTKDMLEKLSEIAEELDVSTEQGPTKAILMALIGSVYAGLDVVLMDHVSQFVRACMHEYNLRN